MFHRGDHAVTEAHSLDESLLVEPEVPPPPVGGIPRLDARDGCPCWGSPSCRALIAAGAITSAAVGARQQRSRDPAHPHRTPHIRRPERSTARCRSPTPPPTTSFISVAVFEPTRRPQSVQPGDRGRVERAGHRVQRRRLAGRRIAGTAVRRGARPRRVLQPVATAQANDRAGNPVGVAYLADASALMQDTILPVGRAPLRPSSPRPSPTPRSTPPGSRDRLHRAVAAARRPRPRAAVPGAEEQTPGQSRPRRRHPPHGRPSDVAGRRKPGVDLGERTGREPKGRNHSARSPRRGSSRSRPAPTKPSPCCSAAPTPSPRSTTPGARPALVRRTHPAAGRARTVRRRQHRSTPP